jgi:hypothetical protein
VASQCQQRCDTAKGAYERFHRLNPGKSDVSISGVSLGGAGEREGERSGAAGLDALPAGAFSTCAM